MNTTFRSLLALLLLAVAARAADIVWTTAAVSGPADVSTAGRLVGALEVGRNEARTVNGVVFAAAAGGLGALALGMATAQFDFDISVDANFWNVAAPGGSVAYDEALDSARFGDSDPGSVTLGGLVAGKRYLVQLWIVDTRDCCNSRVRTVDGVPTSSAGENVATGVFTADAATQVIVFGSATVGPQCNLLQLRELGFVVSNVNDAGPGSLRAALAAAAAQPGADTVVFDPGMNGKTIALTSSISSSAFAFANGEVVTVDASGLSDGVKIDGGLQNFRIFRLNSGASLTLQNLTLMRGGGTSLGGSGGAIQNNVGTLALTRCTLSGNSASDGGALYSNTSSITGAITSSTTLTHCTLTDNTVSSGGGAVRNGNGRTTLTHCTLTGNTAPADSGSGVFSYGDNLTETVVQDSIISGNTASSVDIYDDTTNSFTSRGGNLIGSGNATGAFTALKGDLINNAPLLASLGRYGGPTATRPPLAGSPALDAAATVAGLLADQRGVARGAAIYTNDFSTGLGGATAFGAGVVDSGSFRLTPEAGDQQGTLVLPEVGSLAGFALTFDYQFSKAEPTSDFPADGMSVSIGPRPGGLVSDAGLSGTPRVQFDIYNGGGPVLGVIRYIRPDGAVGATNTTALSRDKASNGGDRNVFRAVRIDFTAAGMLTVRYKNAVVLGPVATGYTVQAGDTITFGARTGGLTAEQRVDNVGILTQPASPPDIGAVEALSGPVAAVVTSTADAGPGTLRELLSVVPAGSTITFDPAVFTGAAAGTNTLALASTLVLSRGVTIDASALPGGITLDGGLGNFRLFRVQSGSLTLLALTLARGGGSGLFTGGAIRNETGSTLTLERCTLSGNQANGADGSGGAIDNLGTLTLTQCTLSGNQADPVGGIGGAIFNGGPLTLTHCTLSGNSALIGGAIVNTGGYTVNLNNTIVSGNTQTGGAPDISNSGTVALTGANFIGAGITNSGGNTTGPAPLTGDAKLGPLADNGGPTKTFLPRPGSPAIDAVPAGSEVALLTTDQRGADRLGAAFAYKVDGDGNGSALADIGALEVRRVVVTTAVDELNTPSLTGGTGLSLREALRDDAASATADHIGFDPAVFTAAAHTIALIEVGGPGSGTGRINVTSSVAVDAASLPTGVTLDGGLQNFSLFRVQSGGALALRGLTLTRGGGSNTSFGGAIANNSSCTLALERCTLSGNQALEGGGAISNVGTLTLTHCTLSGNHADGDGGVGFGGAISNGGTATLTHCTLSNNSARAGGAIFNQASQPLKLIHTLITGNTATNTATNTGPDILNNSAIELTGANFIGAGISNPNSTGTTTGPAPLTTASSGAALLDPAGLADHGGPTQTIALLAGSPCINAASGSTATSDQRSFPIFGGMADLGAFEVQATAPEIAVEQPAGTDLPFGTSVAFASTEVVAGTSAVVFTLRNPGPAALTPTGATPMTLGGADAGHFLVTAQPAATVAAGGSTMFTVRFAPTSTGVKTATLSIASDAANRHPFTLTLTGTGVDTITLPPTIQSPVSGARTFAMVSVSFTLPEAAQSGTVKLTLGATDFPLAAANESGGSHTVTLDATTLPPGAYTLTLSYQDAAGHPAATATVTNVMIRPANPVSTKVRAAAAGVLGDPAPDAGVGISGGPPALATLTSLGVPCVDEAGHLSYLAKWTSPTGSGSGLFHNANALVGLGGDAAGVTGAKYKTLGAPVGSADHVAFLATVAVGSKVSAVVASNAPTVAIPAGGRTPQVIAQAGQVAPAADGSLPAGGATFGKFKAVAIEGDAVAIFAQLSGGTGAEKATAANDLGIWVVDGTHTLRRVLREGDPVGGKTIKTLVSFAPGAGSPGQGRGWLVQNGANGPRVLALAYFTGTDKAQAVLGVGLAGGMGTLAQNFPGGPAPDVTGGAFASFGLAAINPEGKSAFLASLAIAPGIATKADARGLFVDYGNPTYTKIARVTETAGTTGTTFSLIKDPVLAAGDDLAFPATLKATRTVKGLATTTLWWKPLFSTLKLLAQGGGANGVPNDLPAGAQWKTFPSLAIAGGGRGPIFTATLVAGKGGVLAKNASGVWAMDYTGKLRTLFRTDDQTIIAGKTLKSFVVLNASVGSTGVTRSFNDRAQVVWLATFTDKSQAIVTTEIP